MDWKTLIQAALTLVVRFVLVWFFELIGLAVDEAFLNALVAAIVIWLLTLFGIELFRKVPGVRNLIGPDR